MKRKPSNWLPSWRPRASDSLDPAGKVALITGGAAGIGFETARQLQQAGASVVIVDCNKAAAAQAVERLGGDRAKAVVADVTDRDAMRQAVKTAIAQFGRLDVVVANAGITPQPATLRHCDPADFDKVMAVNVTGVFNSVHAAIDELIRQQGHIVVVASAAAFCPPVAGAAYMISKAAVEQLARALRLELALHKVTVTTAYFGVVDTQLASATLDDDPVGRALNQRLPAVLRKRLPVRQAGQLLVEAIRQRAPTLVVPMGWRPYSWLRGVINPLADQLLQRDPSLRDLLTHLDKTEKDHV